MSIVLNTNGQEQALDGGPYKISTFLNGGSASLEVKQVGSTNWAPVGTLTAEPQVLDLPLVCVVRLTKSGSAFIELSR